MVLGALLGSSLLAPLLSEGGSGSEGNPLRQVIYVVLFLAALGVTGALRVPARALVVPPVVVATLAWFLVSLFWAIEPGVSSRRLMLTVMVAWSIFLLVDHMGYEGAVDTVRKLLLVFLVANFAAVFFAPGWAVHQWGLEVDGSIVGAWRGVMMQKNFAGAASALTILFFVLDARGWRPAWRAAIVLAAAYFLFRTESKTSAGFVFLCILAAWCFRFYNSYYRIFALLCIAFAGVVASVLLADNWRLIPFYRDDFLTGRSLIWRTLLSYSQDHLLLGAGFGSFWNIGSAAPIFRYTSGWVAGISSGHNGYIDLLVQVGVPGLALAIWATLLVPLWQAVTCRTLDRHRGGLVLACLMFTLLHNLTESSLFNRDALIQVFAMIGLALLRVETRLDQGWEDAALTSAPKPAMGKPGRGGFDGKLRC